MFSMSKDFIDVTGVSYDDIDFRKYSLGKCALMDYHAVLTFLNCNHIKEEVRPVALIHCEQMLEKLLKYYLVEYGLADENSSREDVIKQGHKLTVLYRIWLSMDSTLSDWKPLFVLLDYLYKNSRYDSNSFPVISEVSTKTVMGRSVKIFARMIKYEKTNLRENKTQIVEDNKPLLNKRLRERNKRLNTDTIRTWTPEMERMSNFV